MLERYKVLGAAMSLGEFTVADLVRFSKVKENTVRTVLGRETRYFEQAGTDNTGRRGGRYARYRVLPNGLAGLRSQIREVATQLDSQFPKGKAKSLVPKIPAGLRFAEDILARRYPKAIGLEAKEQLLDMARISLEGAQPEVNAFWVKSRSPRSEQTIRAHMQCVAALGRLCALESQIDTPSTVQQSGNFLTIRNLIVQAADQLSDMGEKEQAFVVLKRISLSPCLENALSTNRGQLELAQSSDEIPNQEYQGLPQFAVTEIQKDVTPEETEMSQKTRMGPRELSESYLALIKQLKIENKGAQAQLAASFRATAKAE